MLHLNERSAARTLALAAASLAATALAAKEPVVWTRPLSPGRYDGPWQVIVDTDGSPDVKVVDSGGRLVAGPFAAKRFTVIDPAAWTDETPVWYKIVTECGGEGVESVFGFADMQIDSNGLFRVNGRTVRLKPGPKHLNGNAALASDDLTGEEAWKRGVYRLTEKHLKLLSPSSIVHVASEVPEAMAYAFRDWTVKGTNYNQRFVVANRNAFLDASGVTCRWRLLVDGEERDGGEVDLYALGPGREASFDMPPEVTAARLGGGTVSVRFTFERDGRIIAADQVDFPASRSHEPLDRPEGWFSAHLVPGFLKPSVDCRIDADGKGRKTREFKTSRTIFRSDECDGSAVEFSRRGRLWGAEPLVTGVAIGESPDAAASESEEASSPVERRNGVLSFTTALRSKDCAGTARWSVYPSGVVSCRARVRAPESGAARIVLLLSDVFGEETELEWFGRGPFATGRGAFTAVLPTDGAFLGRWETDVELSGAVRSAPGGRSAPFFFSATDVRGLRFGDLTVRTLGAPFSFCARMFDVGGDVGRRPALVLETDAARGDGTYEIAFTLSVDDDELTARMPEGDSFEGFIL